MTFKETAEIFYRNNNMELVEFRRVRTGYYFNLSNGRSGILTRENLLKFRKQFIDERKNESN